MRPFDDPVVGQLLGAAIRTFMKAGVMRRITMRKMDAMARGLYGLQVCCTRYINDAIQKAFSEGIDQLVVFETRVGGVRSRARSGWRDCALERFGRILRASRAAPPDREA